MYDAENAIAGLVADLEERLRRAESSLHVLRDDPATSEYNQARLHGKAEGVRLALSYLREYDRG